ncbi:membrane-associated guanylate kinase, WW and PDZ domain-containing protein 1 [Anastrepha obliqua]|uniref:membrane-associated guanylate kinase, WW and PDZ domain-containing protein 1 n=1 Tax=Anastrepha obliqua TaxID=95512 RepID=UPI00240972CD|nr:membrane-associated guanylate kinase, WW and PDZ domain-containing protein 1 [Anastrepha obliqua]XP_054737004.1 membrane-associated guanylate kinase, WW and PDZ domain-containing protein 1 [Anastrepha obliqua]
MPTLAAKNSQAPVTATAAMMATAAVTETTTATATTNSVGSGQGDVDAAGAIIATAAATTTITDTTNTGGALNHHYHHPPAPQSGPNALGNALPSLAPATICADGAGAATATSTVAASLATFNGNSNLNIANGNIGGNGNHSNNNSNIASVGGGGGKKSMTTLHASREDVASPPPPSLSALAHLGSAMPSASINNHQLSASNSQGNHNHNNNNSNGGSIGSNNGNGNGNINSILKGSKENLLQNCYNGGATSDVVGSEIDDPGDGLGPLPPKWETAYTERGELYFIDHNTGTSHWLDPRLSKFQKKSLEDCGDDELPYGWEKIEDSLYGTYYIDHVNRRTQYENPVLEAKRRAAEQKQKQQHQPPPPAHLSPQNIQGDCSIAQQSMLPHPQSQQRPQTPSNQLPSPLNGGVGGGSVVGGSEGDRVGNVGSGMVDLAQRCMQPPPPNANLQTPPTALLPYKFTRNPAEMQGERITASLVKSARGLGITIVGGDDGAEEFLQIKSIVPHGPASLDGQLQTGDVLVYVNDTCVLGFTHHEMVNIFQSILPGETATLEVCRGYPLPFDPNDPNTEVVTTIAVDGVSVAATDKQRRMLLDLHMDGNYNFLDVSGGDGAVKVHPHNHLRSQHSTATGGLNDGFILMKKPELQMHTFTIVKGAMGFGFTIADSAYGQKVKKILDYNCCTQLQEGDVLLEINGVDVRQQSHLEVVQILKDCSKTEPTLVKIQRGSPSTNSERASPSGGIYSTVASNPQPMNNTNSSLGNVAKLRKNFTSALFRSKTPTADLYSTQQKEILPIRPKTPLVDTRHTRAQTPNDELQHDDNINNDTSLGNDNGRLSTSKSQLDSGTHKSTNSLQEIEAINQEIPFLDPYPKLVTSLSERLAGVSMLAETAASGGANGGGVTNVGYHHAGGLSLPSSVGDIMRYDHQEYVTAGVRGGNNIYGISPLPSSMNTYYAPQQLHTPPHINISASSYSPSTPLSLTTTSATHHNLLHHHPLQLPPPPHPHPHGSQYSPASLHVTTPLQAAHIQNERMQKRVNELLSDRRRVGFSTLDAPQPQKQCSAPYVNQSLLQQPPPHLQHSPAVSSVSQQAPISWLGAGVYTNTLQSSPGGNLPYMQRNGGALDVLDDLTTEQYELCEVTLERQALGFGFRIVGGTEEGSQVTVGHVVPGGAADNDQRINTGDEILSIDGINVVNSSHHKVVSLMGEAALRGQVTMILRRRLRLTQQPHLLQTQHQEQETQMPLPPPPSLTVPLRNTFRYPYDVIVSRHESEGFGFVIISSSNQFYGSTIGKLIPGSPADRCGELKVGDRIIAVNRIDIAGMPHGDVVNLIKESGLHVRLTIGCPKDALTTPTTTAGTPTSALLVNSAQVSPGQLSQTQLLYTPLATQQHKSRISPNLLPSNDGSGTYFIEQPRTSTATNFTQQQHPQLQQQQQQLPQHL